METSLYHDNSGSDAVKKLKRNMTLDFNSEPAAKKAKAGGLANVLSSPDLNMLKLASPELERMIIAQNGMITTPTPTQFVAPTNVTEEQEAYARGFVDALNELRQKEDDPNADEITNSYTMTTLTNAQNTSTMTSMPMATSQAYTTTTSLPGSILPTSQAAVPSGAVLPTAVTQLPSMEQVMSMPTHMPTAQMTRIKEEPQIVPCLGNTPPISPINMATQEVIKQERKRERNRVAARKCRTRKLERISRLEDRVSELKGQNSELSNTAVTLRDQVCKLKQQIMDHVQSGCQVMLSQNLL